MLKLVPACLTLGLGLEGRQKWDWDWGRDWDWGQNWDWGRDRDREPRDGPRARVVQTPLAIGYVGCLSMPGQSPIGWRRFPWVGVPRAARPVPRKRKRPGAAMARDKPEAAAEAEAAPELSYREQLEFLNPIAQPLASRKLTRKLLKCIRKGLAAAGRARGAVRSHTLRFSLSPSPRGSLAATKHKQIRRGVKEVQKFINKGEKG